MLSIIFNTIVLSLDEYPISPARQWIIENFNYFFFIIFCLELILKLVGLGIKGYLKDKFNIFDLLIIILSIIELIVDRLIIKSN